MTDLIDRLREARPRSTQYALGSMILSEAADEIEQLRAERDALLERIEGAAKVEVKEVGDDDTGQPRVLAYSTRDELRKGPPLVFKRVALVSLDD